MPHFLSCLSGSEHQVGFLGFPRLFLSCLSGSERQGDYFVNDGHFLSCLSGSELEIYTVKCWNYKRKRPNFFDLAFFSSAA